MQNFKKIGLKKRLFSFKAVVHCFCCILYSYKGKINVCENESSLLVWHCPNACRRLSINFLSKLLSYNIRIRYLWIQSLIKIQFIRMVGVRQYPFLCSQTWALRRRRDRYRRPGVSFLSPPGAPRRRKDHKSHCCCCFCSWPPWHCDTDSRLYFPHLSLPVLVSVYEFFAKKRQLLVKEKWFQLSTEYISLGVAWSMPQYG